MKWLHGSWHMFMIQIMVLMTVSHSLHGIRIGSDTAVSSEQFVIFPSIDTDNEIRGFASMRQGFALEDNTTTCTFGAFFPIQGDVELNGGTLWLDRDLILHNTTTFTCLGDVRATTIQSLSLASAMSLMGAISQDVFTFENISLALNSHIMLFSYFNFTGDCTIDGGGRVLDLCNTATLIIAPNSTLTLKDLVITNLHGNNIQCADDTGILVLHNVRWVQSDEFSFKKGCMQFKDQVSFLGSATFNYESSQTSTIDKYATWCITDGTKITIGKDQTTGNEPLAFADQTSVLKMDNCSLLVTASGMQLTKGTVEFDRNIDIDMLGTTTDEGIIIGSGQAADDLAFYYTPGTIVNFNSGYFTYKNASPTKVISASKAARLIRQEASHICVSEDFEIPTMTIELVSNAVPPMTVEAGKTLSYNNSAVVLPDVEFDITSDQYDAYTYLLNGNDSLFLTKGALPLGILVDGTGNKIQGNGSLRGAIALQDSAAVLTLGITGPVTNAITLNEGTLLFGGNVVLMGNGMFSGPGTVNVSTCAVDLAPTVDSWTTPINWQSNNGKIGIHGKLSLSSTWTINGNLTMDGHNHTLVLDEGGEIVIEKDGKFGIQNLRIQGVQGNNIRCVDDSGALILDDVEWIQDDVFTFTHGSMTFQDHVSILGTTTFNYESSQTSTITTRSELHVTDGTHICIGRDPSTANEPLSFADETAVLRLDNCSFVVPSPGIQLTKGTIILDRNVDVDIQSTSTSDGAIVGTGSADDDLTIYFSPSTIISFNSGHFIYNNASPNKVKSSSKTAFLIRDIGSYIYVAQDVEMPSLTIQLTSNLVPPMSVAEGKKLTYNNSSVLLPDVEFDITGEQSNAFTYLLRGNESLFFTKGAMPLSVVAENTGNAMRGNVLMLGTITLQDSNADISFDLTGAVGNALVLNNGTAKIKSNLFLMTSCTLTGPGIFDLSTCTVDLPASQVDWDTSMQWKGSGGKIAFHEKYSLLETWTFNGNCMIDGHGNTLVLGTNGAIVVDEASKLHIKNLRLSGVNDSNIRCLANDSVIVLEDVSWQQDANCTFTQGALEFKGTVKMRGSAEFAYETNQTSTIAAESQLKFDTGFTFKYNPALADPGYTFSTFPSQDLLEFEDSTAQLIMNSATLQVTATGMNLTQGNLVITGESNILTEVEEIDGGVNDRSLSLGDETASNDLVLEITPGAILNVKEGSMRYKNVASSSFIMGNDQSLLYFHSGTSMYLYQSMTYEQGIVRFCNNTSLYRAINKKIFGPIDVTGALLFKNLPSE